MDTLRAIGFDKFLLDHVVELMGSGRCIVGVFGPPGSGKTTFTQHLASRLNAEYGAGVCVLVPMDGFHLSNTVLGLRGLADKKGAPQTFDIDGFLALLERLRENSDDCVFAPDYSRVFNEPIAASIEVPRTTKAIFVEGNYLGYSQDKWACVRPLLNELWYLEEHEGILADRLTSRQIAGGKSAQEARMWYESVDCPNIELVKASQGVADRVVGSFVDEGWYRFKGGLAEMSSKF